MITFNPGNSVIAPGDASYILDSADPDLLNSKVLGVDRLIQGSDIANVNNVPIDGGTWL